MDMSVLVKDVVAFLTPFLPYLFKAGEKAAEKAGEKMGEGAWESARTLWGKLRPKVEARPAAQEAVQDVVAQPQDADAQAALHLQLKKILAEEPTLAAEAAALLQAEVVQQVLASGGSRIESVEQQAEGGPTRQEVVAKGKSTVTGVKQIRKK